MTEEGSAAAPAGTDTSEETPLKVEIINQPKTEEKNPTSHDTKDEWNIEPTDEEIKEMIDAQ